MHVVQSKVSKLAWRLLNWLSPIVHLPKAWGHP
jgi:hypothetical protein